jgi:hypothetical protein
MAAKAQEVVVAAKDFEPLASCNFLPVNGPKMKTASNLHQWPVLEMMCHASPYRKFLN